MLCSTNARQKVWNDLAADVGLIQQQAPCSAHALLLESMSCELNGGILSLSVPIADWENLPTPGVASGLGKVAKTVRGRHTAGPAL